LVAESALYPLPPRKCLNQNNENSRTKKNTLSIFCNLRQAVDHEILLEKKPWGPGTQNCNPLGKKTLGTRDTEL
jgi:hypothetical protein